MLHSKLLDDLGRRFQTDKRAGPDAHDYLRKYEFFLKPFQNEAFTFLELGVFKGASLRTWEAFFAQADIVGVDIEERALAEAGPRSRVVIGDLAQNAFLDSLKALKAKVVIDDASHWWPDQLRTLFALYPELPDGGLYIVEDVHTSFEPLAPHFSCGLDYPPFKLLLKIAEYLTGNDRPAPIFKAQTLRPLERDTKFDAEIRCLADLTDAVVFIERACLLIKK